MNVRLLDRIMYTESRDSRIPELKQILPDNDHLIQPRAGTHWWARPRRHLVLAYTGAWDASMNLEARGKMHEASMTENSSAVQSQPAIHLKITIEQADRWNGIWK